MLERGPAAARARGGRRRRRRRDARAARDGGAGRRPRGRPARRIDYRGTAFEEMDLDAVLARQPEVALVDELAHTNVPGSRNEKRWQDVEELLDAGIDVISTLNIQHLESLNDVVEQITGVKQRETIPDEVVRRADQIELVDLTPRRSGDGWRTATSTRAERIDAALGNYFRPGNLGALRELALLWVADRVDEALGDLPRAARDRAAVGDARARARRAHGLARRRASRPAGSADGAAVEGRPRRRPRRPAGRARGGAAALLEQQRGSSSELGGTLPRGRRRRRRQALVDARALAERDPDRARSEPQVALARADARLGDQPRDPRLGRRHRRARDQPARRRDATSRSPAARRAGRRRCRAAGRRSASLLAAVGAAAPDRGARAAARAPRAAERAAALSAPRRRGRRGRRALAGAGSCGRGLPARQLVLHAAAPHVHDRRGRERPRAGRLRRRRGLVSGFVALRRGGPPRARGPRRGRGARAPRRRRRRSPALLESLRARVGLDGAARPPPRRRRLEVDAASGDRRPERPEAATTSIELDERRMCSCSTGGRSRERRPARSSTPSRASSPRRSSSRSSRPRPRPPAALAAANELRTALLSAVSHDLRTPLARSRRP